MTLLYFAQIKLCISTDYYIGLFVFRVVRWFCIRIQHRGCHRKEAIGAALKMICQEGGVNHVSAL